MTKSEREVETVPPPNGAPDAYSAKTRVGTLPEHVLEAMRKRETDASLEKRTKSGMQAAAVRRAEEALTAPPVPVIEIPEIELSDLEEIEAPRPPPLPMTHVQPLPTPLQVSPDLSSFQQLPYRTPHRRSWLISAAIVMFFAVLGGLLATAITLIGR